MAGAVVRSNPYRTPREWGTMRLGAMMVPGIIVSIDGASRPHEWIVQKGISVSGAVTVWRGRKLAESITIVTNLHDAASFDAYHDLRAALIPKSAKQPPTVTCVNGILNFAGITRVAARDVEPPKPTTGLSWLGTILLVDYSPPQQIKAGPADPPKTLTENDRLAAELAETVAQARKL